MRELEQALARRADRYRGAFDEGPAGSVAGAISNGGGAAREDPRDALLIRGGDRRGGRSGQPGKALEPGARIGTSSARRQFESLRLRPDLADCSHCAAMSIRGCDAWPAGDFDAIILAMAGLKRLGKLGAPEGISLRPLDERSLCRPAVRRRWRSSAARGRSAASRMN